MESNTVKDMSLAIIIGGIIGAIALYVGITTSGKIRTMESSGVYSIDDMQKPYFTEIFSYTIALFIFLLFIVMGFLFRKIK